MNAALVSFLGGLVNILMDCCLDNPGYSEFDEREQPEPDEASQDSLALWTDITNTTTLIDVECYPNYFLVLFKDLSTNKLTRIQISPNRKLNTTLLLGTLQSSLLVGFNCKAYDLPLIQCALNGYNTADLKRASDDIIVHDMNARDFADKHHLSKIRWDFIDLMNVAPLKAGLKLYAGRLHAKKLQDLPFDPNCPVTAEQAALIDEYCQNDLANTAILWEELSAQIKLREHLSAVYKQDLRSKSDPQVAETIICAEIEKINGSRPYPPGGLEGASYKYRIPAYIQYKTPQLQAFLEVIRQADFRVAGSGSIEIPQALEKLKLRVAGATYRIGIGGLHSSETDVRHLATEDTLLVDRDVTSYYPAIILRQGLYPQHLGAAFLTVYRSLVERRIAAKKAGEKVIAESLKIAVNGSFGKLGSKYSALYSPDLLIQVTITGQLALLMLIERVEDSGIRVVSANTDGIVIKCPKRQYELLNSIIMRWESDTGLGTEEARYTAIYSKDVNNYIAIKSNGEVKGKGLYANPWEKPGANIFKLHKNPSTTIVIEAVVALLKDGTPLEYTVRGSTDIRKFVSVRSVTGGANQGGVHVGKVVRWYYATGMQGNILNYNKSGNKVPKTDGAKTLMELPDTFPTDVNYPWYITEAKNTLTNIGYGQRTLFGD